MNTHLRTIVEKLGNTFFNMLWSKGTHSNCWQSKGENREGKIKF